MKALNSKDWSVKMRKVNDFFVFLGPFGINELGILAFSCFKAIKAKKDAPVARKTKCHICTSNILNVLS